MKYLPCILISVCSIRSGGIVGACSLGIIKSAYYLLLLRTVHSSNNVSETGEGCGVPYFLSRLFLLLNQVERRTLL